MFSKVDPNVTFPEMEKKWLAKWQEKGLVQKYLRKNDSSKKIFSFQDGPITANNPMGVHHAWGRSYKDLWQKFFNLKGYRQQFQNGFDCQGLWVEVEVEKELGLKSKRDIENLVPGDRKQSIAKFVDLCKARVYKFSGIQTEQSKRLGYFMDWDHSYYTMSDANNYMIWHFLKVAFEHGWIYKGHESVPWCPRCETAISQHEMLTEDYKEVVHESIYFELPIIGRDKEFLLVWTTTPWTLPANIAVAVDSNMDYSLVEGKSGNKFWLAKERIDKVFTEGYVKIHKTVKGKELVGLRYRTAFDDLPAVAKTAEEHPEAFHSVVATDPQILPISLTEGTGMVHTAVSAGVEDFKLGKKLGLPMIPVIADNADYIEGLGQFTGKNAKKHPRIILDYLEEKDKKEDGWVFLIHRYKHRYPACWRCKSELVWKVADEWYIAMDVPSKKDGKGALRGRMMEVAKKITWMPEFGLDRELDWLKNMHDWLISKKNRYWGLALPIYECKKCGVFEVVGSKEELKKRAIAGWDQFEGKTPHKPFIDEVKIRCEKCGAEVSRIDDVGNPWLDAGIVPYSTITQNNQGEPLYLIDKEEWQKWFPRDFITESFPGQFKNWFYAMIAESTVLENTHPFKRVLGFGTLLGEDGRAMHKSWGNSIEFNEGADKIGVDVMRWMFARQNPADNMLFGYKKADEVRRQFYLLLWNVYKFFVEYATLENVTEEELEKTKLGESKHVLDRWILSRFHNLMRATKKSLENYSARDAAAATELFMDEFSTWYIRRSRERLWVNSDDRGDKLNFYKTTHHVLLNLSIILSPIMPFVTEEMYTNLSQNESVHLAQWPEVQEGLIDMKLETEMDHARKLTELGHSLRKELKLKIRQPLLFADHAVESKKIENGDVLQQVLQELNVKRWVDASDDLGKKSVVSKKSDDGYAISLETELTEELKHEGELRDLIRTIQKMRKEQGARSDQEVDLVVPSAFEKDFDFIKKRVQAKSISTGKDIAVNL